MMKINVIAQFPKIKDGMPRHAEELLKALSTKEEVESICLIVWRGLNYVSPSVTSLSKVDLLTLGRYPSFRTLIRLITQYQEGDFLLFLAPPWRVFNPSQAFWLFLLIKYGFLDRSKWIQVLHDFVAYVCPEDEIRETTARKVFDAFKKYFSNVPARYVAVSESTKRDAIRFWSVPANRIAVIRHGSFVTPKTPRTNFGSRKILMVSDISPRKNHVRLIKAFELVYRNNPGNMTELVIAGALRKSVPKFKSTLEEIQMRNKDIKITLPGYLSDTEILRLYEEADVFVYPSLYEGFGLPVLEAMACGCPVIVSNAAALTEVVGEAGLLVDPYDVEALARAMIAVLEDDTLKKEMSRKGIAQAQKFTWEDASAQMLAVCGEVAKTPKK
jgi:glycosyltransferase involved in cell wall biosynthesis